MKFRNLYATAFTLAALSACSGNDPGAANRLSETSAAATAEGENAAPYKNGTPNYTFRTASGEMMVNGVVIESIDSETFAGYQTLARHAQGLATTKKVIHTKESSVELWNDEAVMLALDLRGETPTVLYTNGDFRAEAITYTLTDNGQGPASAALSFSLKECKVVEPVQDQDQDQNQGKGQDQGKGEEQAMEQGQDKAIEEQSKEHDQAKEEEKILEKAEECMTAMVSFQLEEVIEQVKEEQEQDQSKEQDQAKEQPKDQSKDQAEEQDKAIEEQSKDQAEEQSKDQPKDQAEEQDKAIEEQSKDGSSPKEQGK